MEKETIEQRADRLVRQEVWACVSELVSTLALGVYPVSLHVSGSPSKALGDLAYAAQELCAPIDDYEEAAIQLGLKRYETGIGHWPDQAEDPDESVVIKYENWEEACRENGIEPYQREVFEHWIVSDWLADRLIEQGEKVDEDFAGLCVWARTCTGQGVASDGVIQRIAADCLKA
jgi:hypothetical protein